MLSNTIEFKKAKIVLTLKFNFIIIRVFKLDFISSAQNSLFLLFHALLIIFLILILFSLN